MLSVPKLPKSNLALADTHNVTKQSEIQDGDFYFLADAKEPQKARTKATHKHIFVEQKVSRDLCLAYNSCQLKNKPESGSGASEAELAEVE